MIRPSPRRRMTPIAAALAPALLLLGCGDHVAPANPLHPVKGKATLTGPGSLAGMRVIFLPEDASSGARSASGDIQSDGTFALKTEGSGEGIAEGKYKVYFDRSASGPAPKKGAPTIPTHYLDEDDSGLTAEIKPDTTEVGPFELKPQAAGATGKGKSKR